MGLIPLNPLFQEEAHQSQLDISQGMMLYGFLSKEYALLSPFLLGSSGKSLSTKEILLGAQS